MKGAEGESGLNGGVVEVEEGLVGEATGEEERMGEVATAIFLPRGLSFASGEELG